MDIFTINKKIYFPLVSFSNHCKSGGFASNYKII